MRKGKIAIIVALILMNIIFMVSCSTINFNSTEDVVWVPSRVVSVGENGDMISNNFVKTLPLTVIKSSGKYIEEKQYSIFIESDCISFDIDDIHNSNVDWAINVITKNGYYEYRGVMHDNRVYCYNPNLYSNIRVGCTISMRPVSDNSNSNYLLGRVELPFDCR